MRASLPAQGLGRLGQRTAWFPLSKLNYIFNHKFKYMLNHKDFKYKKWGVRNEKMVGFINGSNVHACARGLWAGR
ncbi:hypothetical protein J28TS4_26980 [Paenibacillus lautus]|nr:hypothetical protein J28TS4_26980 [Paenibacillus lautus]